MVPLLYPDQVAEADRRIVGKTGIPEIVLLENAAVSLFDALHAAAAARSLRPGTPVAILCGSGNNGADGMALGRHLAGAGYPVRLILCTDESSLNELAATQLSICRTLPGVDVVTWKELTGLDAPLPEAIVVDAMLGTGATGPLRPPFAEAVSSSANAGLLRLAVDIPTGLDGRTGRVDEVAFRADLTVTMGALKPGLLFNDGPDVVGDIFLSNLSLPSSFYAVNTWVLDRTVAADGLSHPRRHQHKYDRGAVLVVAGSRTMSGAAALAASGALAAGAGLVTVAVPDEAFEAVRSLLPPEVIALPLCSEGGHFTERSFGEIEGELDRFDAIVMGPGVGRSEEAGTFLEEIAERTRMPIVLDADALGREIIAKARGAREGGRSVIITPHHGEMARLLECESSEIGVDPLAIATSAEEKFGVSVVLKGAPTVIAADGRRLVNSTGNAGMATGGTGDVLAGVIGALIAPDGEADVLERMAAAVWCHSRAADMLLEDGMTMHGLTPTAILARLDGAIGELVDVDREERWSGK